MMQRQHIPFGRRGSVTARSLSRLPDIMQAEGFMLLREMGLSIGEMAAETGWPTVEIRRLLASDAGRHRRSDEESAFREGQ